VRSRILKGTVLSGCLSRGPRDVGGFSEARVFVWVSERRRVFEGGLRGPAEDEMPAKTIRPGVHVRTT